MTKDDPPPATYNLLPATYSEERRSDRLVWLLLLLALLALVFTGYLAIRRVPSGWLDGPARPERVADYGPDGEMPVFAPVVPEIAEEIAKDKELFDLPDAQDFLEGPEPGAWLSLPFTPTPNPGT